MTEDLTTAAESADVLEQEVRAQVGTLTAEQQEQLSKALFPDTHTDKVTLCGKERTLRPLTIKCAKQISVLLSEFQKTVEGSQGSGVTIDVDLLDYVMGCSKILADYYGWEDVLEKIDEEDLLLSELQALVVHQMHLQEMNDFLLVPLRVLVNVMQEAEIAVIRLQTMFSGLVS